MSLRHVQNLIIGGGPAGTSAALALAESGQVVHLIDAGTRAIELPPEGRYLDLRFHDATQRHWQLGKAFQSLRDSGGASPKLRVPGLSTIFEGYADANLLRVERGFQLLGALAGGGLSNAWGCGVGLFNASELGPLADLKAMQSSYARVAARMGLSGSSEDALSGYFGLDDLSDPPLPLDYLHQALWERRSRLGRNEFLLGRARIAVLSRNLGDRSACDLRGMCLWGCRRHATWSASQDLARLQKMPRVCVEVGVLAVKLQQEVDGWTVCARAGGEERLYKAKKVMLAAGTIASTRLALAALDSPPESVRLLSNPMAAFLVTQLSMLGKVHQSSFGLAQLSYVLEGISEGQPAFGNLFSTSGLPVSEFLRYLPVTRRAGLPLLRTLLPMSIVGNVFLPGSLSQHVACLNSDKSMTIKAGANAKLPDVYLSAEKRLRRGFRRLGAWMLPGSFVAGQPGADIHYAGTLPIRENPDAHECKISGEIAGLPGVYVIDGACLPVLPAKAHTLTIVANADRIARGLFQEGGATHG